MVGSTTLTAAGARAPRDTPSSSKRRVGRLGLSNFFESPNILRTRKPLISAEEGDDQAAVEENARFDADAEEAYFGTGESGNDAAPPLKIGGVNISSKEACDGPCADKKCPAAQQLTIRAKGEEAATVTMWNVRHCPK